MTHPWSSAALRYANDGWPIFVLGRNKRPIANCRACPSDPAQAMHDPQACRCLTCHGVYAATRDPQSIARMFAVVPNGMVAIRTGAASGLVVVDVDPAKGGRESLTRLVADGLTPLTRYVRTGSGGLHLYYRHPGPHVRVANSAGRLAAGIDIRADGGYVVAPPSIHPRTRQPYVWANHHAPIAEMAAALAAAVVEQTRPASAIPISAAAAAASGAGAISHPDRLMTALLAKVRNAPPGRRRVTLYGCARGAARIVASGVISPADAQAALLKVGLAVGQTERSALAAIAGGFRDEGVIA